MTEKVVNPLGAGMVAAFTFLAIHELRQHTVTCAWSGEVPGTALDELSQEG